MHTTFTGIPNNHLLGWLILSVAGVNGIVEIIVSAILVGRHCDAYHELLKSAPLVSYDSNEGVGDSLGSSTPSFVLVKFRVDE